MVCGSELVCATLLWPRKGLVQIFVVQSGGAVVLTRSSCHGDGRSPGEARMRSGQGAFCSVWFCSSVTLIIARNTCFSEVQPCHLFSVEAGRMSEVMFEF